MPKILFVEDDHSLALAVKQWLLAEHYTVEVVHTGFEAIERLGVYQYDAIILDWHLPDVSGLEICRLLRGKGETVPVLMLTGKKAIDEKELGFDAGVDDYLTKPFEVRELSARLRALIRRPRSFLGGSLHVRNITLEPGSFRVTKNGEDVQLSPKEFALLEFLMRHPNQVFSADALLQRVWHADSDVAPETVRTHIKNLRSKIDTEGQPSLLTTVHRLGYKLDVPEATGTQS